MQGSYFWLRTTWLYTRCINEKIDSNITEIWRAFRRSVPFLKDFWEPMSVNVRVVLLVEDDLTLYAMYQRKDRLSHYWNLTSLSAFGFILKDFFFLETDVGKCEGHTFGWGWRDSIHNGYNRTNEKIGSCITKNWRAFRRSVSFWKIFFGNRCL